jgi:hypothetical protein
MGSITRSFANNITTSGVLLPASLVNNSLANVTSYNAAIALGNMILISSQTASNSASISFTTGINSTYKEYQFWFINIRPATNNVDFQFNGSTDSGSNYNVTKTSTSFNAYHDEGGTEGALVYNSGYDLAQSTAYQNITNDISNSADMNTCATMSLFNPASTTYVKHFIATTNNNYNASNFFQNDYLAGYFNTTSAINAINFQMSSGNIADGTILMYGIV